MTTDQSAAEESLRALARDLVEELAAGRAVELAEAPDDGDVELSVFNVRPFTRQQRTRTGRVIQEGVRGHSAHREGPGLGDTIASGEHYVAGAPGHVIGNVTAPEWSAGQKEWVARGKAVDRLHDAIGKTITQGSGTGEKNPHAPPDVELYHRMHVRPHMENAQRALQARAGDQGKIDQPKLSEAYHHLVQAHQAGVEHLLPRAQEPEAKQAMRKHLDTIQGHLEQLDKITGHKPDLTRKIVGTVAQQNERAAQAREDAKNALIDTAERGDTEAVRKLAREHQGLVEPEHAAAAQERAGQVAADRVAQQVQERYGLRVGDSVRVTHGAMRGGRGTLASIDPNGEMGHISEGRGLPLVPVALSGLKSEQPEYPRGASAIYPQAGQHARAAMPGGTLSGHEMANRAVPVPMQSPEQHPAEAELQQMKQQVEKFRQREAQRAQSDLKQHLADIKAAEAAYKGIAPEGTYQPLTDEQFAVHQAFVAQQVERALRAGLATDQAHSLDGQGQVWTPERALQHSEIIHDYLNKQVDVPSQREALFMGGLPGAGKSGLLKHHPSIDLKNYAVLNPDDFKEELANRGMVPEVPGLSPLESAALVHEESAYLTDLAARELENRGKNVAWDVTMKNHDITAPRVRQLKDKGYRVHGVFVDVPVEKSAERVESRYRKGLEKYRASLGPSEDTGPAEPNLGGRFIPRNVILAGESEPGVSRARATFDKLRPQLDSWELHDGTVRPVRLVEQSHPQPAGHGIPSVEALRSQVGANYTGATEQAARATETGQAARDTAGHFGLTQANPPDNMEPEESESR